MSHRFTRRGFLKGTVAAAGITVLTGGFRANAYAQNSKLNTALIGVGGQGGASHGAAMGENLVAMCDVEVGRMGDMPKKNPQAKVFSDYRKMFDEVKGLNAVFVATPDHTHFPASMMAIANGASVYCEKPLTHSIWEARTLAEAARKAKVASQMGNQGHSTDGPRLLSEFIWAGAIGKVTEVHVWTDRPVNWWPQGVDRPAYTDPVPANLNWDAWLGVAPERPFCQTHRDGPFKGKAVYHPFVWRGWWDFGTGALGDIACHAMAPAFMALKLGYPESIEAVSDKVYPETGPMWSIITYRYPARGDMPPVKLVWYDGKQIPPRPKDLDEGRNLGDNGSYYVGDKGTILFDGTPRLVPETKMKEYKRPEPSIPRIPNQNHREDFLVAARGGRPACSNFDFAGVLTEAALTGNLAVRLGKKIEWDAANLKAKNAPEADAIIHRPYRKGWGV